MKTATVLLNLLVAFALVVFPIIARVEQDTPIYDVYQQEWTRVGRYWFVQVDDKMGDWCYIEWNLMVHPYPMEHHEGWILCSRLMPK